MIIDSIAETLNIASVDETKIELPAILPTEPGPNTACIPNEDFDFARKNLKELVDKGQKALDSILEVAELSQHPRAYEVTATLLSALGNINKQLTEIAKDRVKLDPTVDEKNKTESKTVNNVFVGSTAELASFLEQKRVR